MAKEQIHKISGRQLFSLTAAGVVGGSIMIIAGFVADVAKQDAWISALLGVAGGLPLILLYYYLGRQYPEHSWVGICKKILGRWPGSVTAILYIFLFISTAANITWYIGNFAMHLMHETPVYAILFLFDAVLVIALLYGVEAMSRTAQIILNLVTFLFVIAMLMLTPHMHVENLLPVLENGLAPPLKGTVFILAFIAFPLIPLMMIYPKNVADLREAKKQLCKGYLWGSMIVFITILMAILVLGSPIVAGTQFPLYLLAQQIKVGEVFNRMEFLVSTVWLMTQFVINYIFFYAGQKGLGEMLGLKDDRKIILPLGLVVLALSGITYPDVSYQIYWDAMIWPPYITTFGLVIPLLMLIVFWIRKALGKESGS